MSRSERKRGERTREIVVPVDASHAFVGHLAFGGERTSLNAHEVVWVIRLTIVRGVDGNIFANMRPYLPER